MKNVLSLELLLQPCADLPQGPITRFVYSKPKSNSLAHLAYGNSGEPVDETSKSAPNLSLLIRVVHDSPTNNRAFRRRIIRD